jgi:NhaA family Na+:H+ antiporter
MPIIVGAIILSLVIGKPLGILLFSWVGAHLTPLELFASLKVRHLIGAASLGGIGFTVSFLIASLSFQNQTVAAFATLGVLLGSLISAVLGALIIYLTTNQQISWYAIQS